MPLPVTVRRLGYRVAYRVLQLVWLISRPRQTGVKCLLAHDERILLVRHTYGVRSWDLPGGMVRRGEDPESTARREMREELGVQAPEWVDLGSMRGSMDHRHDTIHVYGARLAVPSLTLDRGELDAAKWFSPDQLPELRPLSAQILRHALPLVLPEPVTAGEARPPRAAG